MLPVLVNCAAIAVFSQGRLEFTLCRGSRLGVVDSPIHGGFPRVFSTSTKAGDFFVSYIKAHNLCVFHFADSSVSDYLLCCGVGLAGVGCGYWGVAQIGIMYVCVKGLLNSTLGLVKLSYCKKTLHIDGNACQTMSSIAMTPWSIKGIFGVLSDSYAPPPDDALSDFVIAAMQPDIKIFL